MPSVRNGNVSSHENRRRDTKFIGDVHTFDCWGKCMYTFDVYMVESISVHPLGLCAYMLGKLGVSSSQFIVSFRVANYNNTTARECGNSCVKTQVSASDLNYRNCSERQVSFPPSHYYYQHHHYRQREAYQACAVTAACFHIHTDTPLRGNSKLLIFTKTTAFCHTPTHRQ